MICCQRDYLALEDGCPILLQSGGRIELQKSIMAKQNCTQKFTFGTSHAVFYNSCSKKPFGTSFHLDAFSISNEVEPIDIRTGHFQGIIESIDGDKTGELSMTLSSCPSFFDNFDGSEIVESTSSSGQIVSLANIKGDTLVNNVDGIDSVNVSLPSKLRQGKYVICAVSATEVNVYLHDCSKLAADGEILQLADNDTGLVNASPIAIAGAGADTAITGVNANGDVIDLGIQIKGGSATDMAFTVGDTACFYVVAENSNLRVKTFRGSSQTVPIGVKLYTCDNKGHYKVFDVPKVRLNPVPVSFERQTPATFEITGTILVECCTNTLYTIEEYDSQTLACC